MVGQPKQHVGLVDGRISNPAVFIGRNHTRKASHFKKKQMIEVIEGRDQFTSLHWLIQQYYDNEAWFLDEIDLISATSVVRYQQEESRVFIEHVFERTYDYEIENRQRNTEALSRAVEELAKFYCLCGDVDDDITTILWEICQELTYIDGIAGDIAESWYNFIIEMIAFGDGDMDMINWNELLCAIQEGSNVDSIVYQR